MKNSTKPSTMGLFVDWSFVLFAKTAPSIDLQFYGYSWNMV